MMSISAFSPICCTIMSAMTPMPGSAVFRSSRLERTTALMSVAANVNSVALFGT